MQKPPTPCPKGPREEGGADLGRREDKSGQTLVGGSREACGETQPDWGALGGDSPNGFEPTSHLHAGVLIGWTHGLEPTAATSGWGQGSEGWREDPSMSWNQYFLFLPHFSKSMSSYLEAKVVWKKGYDHKKMRLKVIFLVGNRVDSITHPQTAEWAPEEPLPKGKHNNFSTFLLREPEHPLLFHEEPLQEDITQRSY